MTTVEAYRAAIADLDKDIAYLKTRDKGLTNAFRALRNQYVFKMSRIPLKGQGNGQAHTGH